MDDDRLDGLDAVDAPFTVPLIGGNATAIKRLANTDFVTNLGLQVRPDGKCTSQLEECKDRIEDWTNRGKTSNLPARGVWQSYSPQLWSSTKYGLRACAVTLKELEGSMGSTNFYLISMLGVARSIPTALRYMPHVYCGMELIACRWKQQ